MDLQPALCCAKVKMLIAMLMFLLAQLVSVGHAQNPEEAENIPFTPTWSKGKCQGCKNAARLGEIQFVSRSEAWAVGSEDHSGGVNVVVIHSTDGGGNWREVPQSKQYTDPDAQLAFSFLDVTRGWIAARNRAGDPALIITSDGGQHWRSLSQQFLQRMQFLDRDHGYGTVADEFFRTDDGGRSWVKTKIPDIVFYRLHDVSIARHWVDSWHRRHERKGPPGVPNPYGQ